MAEWAPRLRFGIFIQEWAVSAEDADTLYSLFETPETLIEYLRAFDFIIADARLIERLPAYAAKRGNREQYRLFPYAALRQVAGAYPPEKLAAMAFHLDLFSGNLPSAASFKKLEKRAVAPEYAALLWKLGYRITAILDFWNEGVPLEFITAMSHDAP